MVKNDSHKAMLAEERTDLARQRNLLANERTFSAWLRTGLAAVIAGLGIARLLDPGSELWAARVLGAIFILAGGISCVIALWRYEQGYRELEVKGSKGLPIWLPTVLTFGLLAGAVLAFILLFQE